MTAATWLLPGIPRSGTSLCCRLVGSLPEAVALSEPLRLAELDGLESADDACEYIDRRLVDMRQQAQEDGRVPSTHVDGELNDSRVALETSDTGLRAPQGVQGEMRVDKPLSPDFLLLVKHNALFAALMPPLSVAHCCIALVRNPVAVLASWQTVDLPVNRGQLPGGELYDSVLRARLAGESDTLQRQLHILDWFFRCYSESLPGDRILKYEEVIASGGRALFSALGREVGPMEDLASQNSSRLYANVDIARLSNALASRDGAWRSFYTDVECHGLAEQLRGGL